METLTGKLKWVDLGAGAWTLTTDEGITYNLVGHELNESLKTLEVDACHTLQGSHVTDVEVGSFSFVMNGNKTFYVEKVD